MRRNRKALSLFCLLFLLFPLCLCISACDLTSLEKHSPDEEIAGGTEPNVENADKADREDKEDKGEDTEGAVDDSCKHNFWEYKILKDSTCIQEGERLLMCTKCGAKKTEKIPLSEHKLSDREETVPATCEGAGESAQVCSVCKEKFNVQETSPLGHSMYEFSLTPATCKDEGERVLKCERCDKKEYESLPLSDHTWEYEAEVVKPTCTKEGMGAAVCKVCGLRENQKTIPALGHDYQETVNIKATCEEAGKVERVCSRCGDKEEETIQAKGHSMKDNIIKEPTCTEEGLNVPVCSVCGKEGERKTIAKYGHKFSDWKCIKDATCEEDGKESRTCTVCGETENKTLTKLGHNFSDEFTVDIPPTKEREGERSRHCQNPGCNRREEIQKIEKLEDRTNYSVTLTRTSGETLTSSSPTISVLDEEGTVVSTSNGSYLSANLLTSTYSVKVENLPQGFYLEKESFPLTSENPSIKIAVPAHMIMEDAPYSTKYVLGDVIHDREVQLVELNEEDDRKIKISELLTTHKAILFNIYFSTCPACIREMAGYVRAHNALTSSGTKYGDEVACVLLDYQDGVDTVRKVKHQTNVNLPQYNYEAAYNIPLITLHDAWLTAFFHWKIAYAFPTSILVDSEGVIVETWTGAMSESSFKNMMQRGIDRYERTQEWKRKEGISSESVPQGIAPQVDLLKGESAIWGEKRRSIFEG